MFVWEKYLKIFSRTTEPEKLKLMYDRIYMETS
jgi:hypothetical protein